MSRTPTAVKERAAQLVREARAEGRGVNKVVAALAAQHGVSRSTVFNWARQGTFSKPAGPKLTRDELIVVARFNGNVRAAWEHLSESGQTDVSYATFCRRLHRVPTDFRVAVTDGVQAMSAVGLYNRMAESLQRSDVFGFDHTEAPVWVYTPGDDKPRKMWVSIAVDWGTGYIFDAVWTSGQGLRGDPNTATLKSLVASVMMGQEHDGLTVGGVPTVWMFDNAAAHLSDAMRNGFATLDTRGHAIRRGSPWENGATENAVNVIERRVWSRLYGYSHGLQDQYGRDEWRRDELLTPEMLVAATTEGIARINRNLPLARNGNQTRREAWAGDPRALKFASPADLDDAFLVSPRGTHKVHKDGVEFGGVRYIAPELAGHVGRSVEVRHLPTDPSFIQIRLDGEVLCHAKPHKRLTPDERARLARVRRNRVAQAQLIHKRSRELAKAEADREIAEAVAAGEDVDDDVGVDDIANVLGSIRHPDRPGVRFDPETGEVNADGDRH